MRISLEFPGRRYVLDVTAHRDQHDFEPSPQGSQCGVLERAECWDHDTREPIGFTRNESRH